MMRRVFGALRSMPQLASRQFSTGRASTATSVRILSDIHLEFRKTISQKLHPFLMPKHNSSGRQVLGLLGDIGSPFEPVYSEFIGEVSKNYDHVFVITGNHEYYNYPEKDHNNLIDGVDTGHRAYNMKDVNNKVRDIASRHNNVSFLNNTSKFLYGYTFLGTTLWSSVTTQREYVSRALSDYYRIYRNNSLITVDDTNSLHDRAVSWLKKELSDREKKFVVFSHHSPLINSSETPTAAKRYLTSKNTQAFQTDLSQIIKPPILYWGFGHTHFTTQYKYNGVVISSNQVGYDHEKAIYASVDQLCELPS